MQTGVAQDMGGTVGIKHTLDLDLATNEYSAACDGHPRCNAFVQCTFGEKMQWWLKEGGMDTSAGLKIQKTNPKSECITF